MLKGEVEMKEGWMKIPDDLSELPFL